MSWIKCEKHKLSVADGSRIPCPDCLVEKARAEVLAACISFVDKQANDEGLWFRAQTAPEAYLQKELRRLHALIESQPAAKALEELLLQARNSGFIEGSAKARAIEKEG
jgi:hypothetical protein